MHTDFLVLIFLGLTIGVPIGIFVVLRRLF
jgi:hypothetical protein